ncbi:MAG: rRNA maturation RNase YbeY [Pseudomonadota bacterium]|uniref:rRNA maturation RNase YbeY n=1 Tax=Fodinicurvata fenggangensis TaxID=1121830 RepID=UPI0009DD7F5D|nr:rRNA maturation RNase YbeY [Fodinicurvata fenggangensis]
MNDEPPSPSGLTEYARDIDIIHESEAWQAALPEADALLHETVLLGLRGLEENLEVCVVLADDLLLQELNRNFRDKDRPTNVLSFPSDDLLPDGMRLLGDVVLSYDTCADEAREQGKSLRDHARHLTLHGVLHLLGHDHEAAEDAEEMERLEVELLAELGVANPYAEGTREPAGKGEP